MGGSYNNKKFGFSAYSTDFQSGETSQTVGGFNVRHKNWNITYENDWAFGLPTGDNGDRFRTAAASIAYKDFAVGLNMFTGDPGATLAEREATIIRGPGMGPHGTYGGEADKYRAGLLYARYGNYRFGTDSEVVRAFVQNDIIHRAKGVAYFRQMNSNWNSYFQYATRNPFTLW